MGSQNNVERTGEGYLLFIVLLVHLLDFLVLNFDMSNPASWVFRVLLYTILAIIGYIKLSGGPDDHATQMEVFIVSAISALVVPFLLSILRFFNLTSNQTQPFEWAIMLIPVWLLYLLFYKGVWGDSKVTRIVVGFYVIFVLIVFLLFISTSVIDTGRVGDLTFDSKIRPSEVLSSFWKDYIKATFLSIGNQTSFNFSTQAALQGDLVQFKNTGESYQGRVEAVDERTGIFLDNINIRDEYRLDSLIRIPATVRVRTFSDEEVDMNFACSAFKNNGDEIKGNVSQESIKFQGLDSNTVFCEFDNLGTGSYRFRLDAYSNFTTSAYTLFYFAKSETMVELFNGNEPIDARSYGISEDTDTQYTSGPVEISMLNSETMPIPVHSDRETNFYLEWRLENLNQRVGELETVRLFEVHLPDIFKISSESCTLPISAGPFDSTEEEDYLVYEFELDGEELSSKDLGCSVSISPSDGLGFVGGGPRDRSDSTVYIKTKYEYNLIERGDFRVTSR